MRYNLFLIYIIHFISNMLIHLDYRLLRFKLFDLIKKLIPNINHLDILLKNLNRINI